MPVFTPATAAEAAAKSHASRKGNGKGNELRQALELQSLAYTAAQAIYPAVSLGEKPSRENAMALAALVKAWDSMANRIRVLRGVPMPGSRRPIAEPVRSLKRPKNLPPRLGIIAKPA